MKKTITLIKLVVAVLVTGGCACVTAQVTPPQGSFTMAQTISDGAQLTTLAFDGLAIMTGNLDSHTSEEIFLLLKALNDQGQTIVMVTHDPKAAAYGNRIVTLKDGAPVQDIAIGEQAA